MLQSVWTQVSVTERRRIHVCLFRLSALVYYWSCMFPHTCVSLCFFWLVAGSVEEASFSNYHNSWSPLNNGSLAWTQALYELALCLDLLPHLSLSEVKPQREWTWNYNNGKECVNLTYKHVLNRCLNGLTKTKLAVKQLFQIEGENIPFFCLHGLIINHTDLLW